MSAHHRRHLDVTSRPAADHLAVGRYGEGLAADHLEREHGLRVVARNWRVAVGELRGELDLVAIGDRHGLIVVCEVKTRSGDGYGGPLLAVTPRKQARVRALTVAFLGTAELPHRQVRFDVIGIRLARRHAALDHLEGAF